MSMPDPADLRRDYKQAELNESSVDRSPFEQFRSWFEQACSADITEPNAMTLCTVDVHGLPDARTVLLKAYDERGIVFYTNYNSSKAHAIAANPEVAVLFPWLPLERQLKILGRAEKISTADSLKYFMGRPFKSKLGAWVSDQSSVIGSRKVLEMKMEEMKRKFANGEVPLPDHWGGFRIVPRVFEFWQGRRSRLHDRIQYRLNDGQWIIERLAP